MLINHRLAASAAALALAGGGIAAALIAPAHASGIPGAPGTWACSAADSSSLVGQLLQGTSIQLTLDFNTAALDTAVDPGSALSGFAFPATLPLGGYVSQLANAGVQSIAISVASFPITIAAPTPETISTSLISPQTTLDDAVDPGIQFASTPTQGTVTAPSTAGSYDVTAPSDFDGDIMLVDPAVAGGSTAPFDAGALSCFADPTPALGTLDDGVPSSPPPTTGPTAPPTSGPTGTPSAPALPATAVTARLAKATITEGQVARISATVAPSAGSGDVTGGIVARIQSATMAGPVQLQKGAGSLDLRDLSAGTYDVTVAYLGSDEYAPSSSDVLQLTVTASKKTKG